MQSSFTSHLQLNCRSWRQTVLTVVTSQSPWQRWKGCINMQVRNCIIWFKVQRPCSYLKVHHRYIHSKQSKVKLNLSQGVAILHSHDWKAAGTDNPAWERVSYLPSYNLYLQLIVQLGLLYWCSSPASGCLIAWIRVYIGSTVKVIWFSYP